MSDFKREDYIYLRYVEDDKEAFRKKGEIVRYKKSWVISELKDRKFNTCFGNVSLIWNENPDALEDDVAFDKVYSSVVVPEDMRGSVYLAKDDYLCLDDWLFAHLSPYDIEKVKRIPHEKVPNQDNDNLVILKDGCPFVDGEIKLLFRSGEVIDFSLPSVKALFYNQSWLKEFFHTETITGEEKEKLFQEDFSNAIDVIEAEDSLYSVMSTCEHHYFKMKDGIRVKTDKEVAKLLGWDYFGDAATVRDEDGFVTHLCTVTHSRENSDRDIEQSLLKIADRIPASEALKVHEKACYDYIRNYNAEMARIREEYRKELKALDDLYQTKKDDSEMFPGANGDFKHVDKENDIAHERYTLKQIQGFYQSLKLLDPEILKHICFYGGTVPYILSNATESRDFGDVDMFVPLEFMEKLRKEFFSQESFEMISDSKPLAEACMLTTRVPKPSTDIVPSTNGEVSLEEAASSIFEAFMGLMNRDRDDYIDADGVVHNPLTINREDKLPYYRKVQDFGFKARLFGINISVFPIYEHEHDLMAKSFNIGELHKFLLGVRVLDNTRLEDFVKPVSVYGSSVNVLPLEYTLASKQSAQEGGYEFRSEKDKIDIEYILAHRDELGISDEKLQEILNNYPDYSISIAYHIIGNQIETLGGEEYKRLVLTNRNVS